MCPDDGSPQLQTWTPLLVMRLSESEDIFDICWSSCGRFILAGTSDKSAHLFDAMTGKAMP